MVAAPGGFARRNREESGDGGIKVRGSGIRLSNSERNLRAWPIPDMRDLWTPGPTDSPPHILAEIIGLTESRNAQLRF